ncbi:MAG: 25S rRNA (adenine645-N1)-methyltransferase [Piccolia ochrophora]|nr:MAG: 25S rRNA (adenine645-N1)-methyltransferase [Piccolia ochrophora]
MFAVPGWSVSADALKPQTAEHLDRKPTRGHDAGKGSKKRKRGDKQSKGVAVTPENVADLWDEVIEGRTRDKANGDAAENGLTDKKRRKKPKNKMGANQEPIGDARLSPTDKGKDPVAPEPAKEKQHKSKSRKDKKREEDAGNHPSEPPPTTTAPQDHPQPPPSLPAQEATKLTPLQASMRQKLISARFRHLNETLYTTPSSHASHLFASDPSTFTDYHAGFRAQVAVWPENPVDSYIADILRRGKIRPANHKKPHGHHPPPTPSSAPLPRTSSTCTIADLGAGEAHLAAALKSSMKPLRLRILSYDLHSTSPLVTRADVAALPIPDASVDVAIFCLALMGTNWVEFIDEAFRVLRWKGELWVAEIKSRFERGGVSKTAPPSSSTSASARGRKAKTNPTPTTANDDANDADNNGNGNDNPLSADRFLEPWPTTARDQQLNQQQTGIASFTALLKAHGFVTREARDGEPHEAAVDARNKMFVKMAFVKGMTPVRGRVAVAARAAREKDGMVTGAKQGRKKFLDDDDEGGDGDGRGVVEEEGKVLKPCVYKLR